MKMPKWSSVRWRQSDAAKASKLFAASIASAFFSTSALAQLPPPLKDAKVVTTKELAISPAEYGFIYDKGWSVRGMTDSKEIYVSGTVESIGEVEDVIIDRDGRVLSFILEYGGFGDFADTHVNIPWELVELGADERIVVPNLDEHAADYPGAEERTLSRAQAENELQPLEEGFHLQGAWRATELMDAPIRLPSGGQGLVNDLIIDSEGKVAVVITRS